MSKGVMMTTKKTGWIRIHFCDSSHEEMAEDFQAVLREMGISVDMTLNEATSELYIELEVMEGE
jgi:hypothetical protein